MFPSSTQKRHWTFGSQAELDALRAGANAAHIARYRPLFMAAADGSEGKEYEEKRQDGEEVEVKVDAANKSDEEVTLGDFRLGDFLTPDEETMFCRIVMETGLKLFFLAFCFQCYCY
jgi:hypothetical protein